MSRRAKECDATKKAYDPVADTVQDRARDHHHQRRFGGKIYDVQFKDSFRQQQRDLRVIQVGNTVLNPTVPIVDNVTWYSAAAELNASGGAIDVRIMCLANAGFANQVSVRARSAPAPAGTFIPANTDDTATESAANVASCAVDVNPLVDLTKDCKGLSLTQGTDGKLASRRCARPST